MDNFSAIDLREIPEIVKSSVVSINTSVQQLQMSCNNIANVIYDNIGSQWRDVANYYGKINEKITSITAELIETINKYIESTVSNETSAATDVSGINEQLQHLAEQLNDITF